MATKIIDVDTSVRPFLTVQPTRYTLTDQDTVRVSVGLQLQEIIQGDTGTDKFDTPNGIDIVTFLDGETSDTERSRQVGQVILTNQYVTGFIVEPAVTLVTADDGTPQYRVTTTVQTIFGPVPLEF